MEKARDVLGRVLKTHDISRADALGRLVNSWPSLVGSSIAAHTLPVDLRNKVLFLSVDSPVWMQQLSFLKSDLLEKMHGRGIDDIILRLGRVKPDKGSSSPGNIEGCFDRKPLSGQDLAYIEKCAEGLEDPGLRQTVLGLLHKVFTRERGKSSG